ncbi:LacI family DNA-binding transcriptional regulator [Erwiniaceae bacterium BAC15a-03b]|uniref:LacI family DNA-binding transcriptional regulator n=1 Tax=Winslowiella arboricola TaxID=2978220 RepID=A0A9J6PTR4_9GAMM|nr:LacI family DNA-binding transcriptional regulator [Winslowiella arboricola]MCU5774770.1 LacI family DNA-binding transcriptional regulator [Winslowiella arboricola]MCU5780078.1 LacI family DNA-binding transcriptional regulator [Winslowiella arboricola]
MKKLTLEGLAKTAGVGVATVDRVLNERGGVSPATTRKVLEAARAAGLNRILPEEHRHPWQLEVVLSGNDSFFFKQLAQDFSDVASGLGYRRLTLHRTFIPESRPDKLAAHIVACSSKRDGLIVFAHEYSAIYDALALCKQRGVPVITIVSDLPGAERLCHVGINQLQAGRTAGLLMGKMLHTAGEVIMISGRFDYTAHRLRIQGFRDVLQQDFPHIGLREVLAGQEQRDTISKLLEKQLSQAGHITGIYNTGLGNREISEALARHRMLDKSVFITHELYRSTRELLAKKTLSLTIDQNTRQHAQLATDIMLRHLDSGDTPETYASGKVEFMLFTGENYA